MSNYPNMSYVMCENTLYALRQVITAMIEQGPDFLQGTDREELQAYKELFDTCEQFLTAAEKLEDECNREEQDGQPSEHDEWVSFDPDC